ncbi:MAG: regulatory protein RecX [Gammaproteobacteria bacterium]|nr:regulatory protein RecX [Gammaproteobacteria bacterium]
MTEKPSENLLIRKKAMDYLSRREHSYQELIKKLGKKDFNLSLVNIELEKLIEDGLQSDSRFTESFIRSRKNQGKGPLRIRSELSIRGVASQLINDGIQEVKQEEWTQLAVEVLEKKLGNDSELDYHKQLKLMRFLSTRGFDKQQVKSAINCCLENLSSNSL